MPHRAPTLRLLAVLLLAALPAAAQMPGSLPLCPVTGDGFSVRCNCWGPGNGPVWGTDVYAVESSVCAAARHAGVIGEVGGTVRVLPMAGQAQYRGSHRNGITSQDKGSSRRSFRIERGTDPWAVPQGR